MQIRDQLRQRRAEGFRENLDLYRFRAAMGDATCDDADANKPQGIESDPRRGMLSIKGLDQQRTEPI